MTLQTALDQLAARHPDHLLGVAVNDVISGATLAALHADQPFQLASVFKIPVLVATMRQVDAGRLDLDARHALTGAHRLIGSGVLAALDVGLQPTLRDLLTLMIVISDNTATDMILGLIGGPLAVDRAMRDLDIANLHIHHDTRALLHAVFPADVVLISDAELAAYAIAHNLPRHDERIAPEAATNTGTPAALNALLGKLARGECAASTGTETMLTIMQRQQYNQRLPKTWPETVVFAHKTGTISDMRADCGILALPDRKLAISAFARAQNAELPLSPAVQAAGDALLASVGALIWEHLQE